MLTEHQTAANETTTADLQQYLPLVRQIVSRFLRRLPPNVLRDDLMAAGTYGLIDSLGKNGSVRGPAFEWYARVRIRGAILDELRSQDWLTRRARLRVSEANQASPSSSGPTVVGFEDLPEGARGGFTDTEAASPFELVAERREQVELAAAVSHLPERERLIVTLYYFKGVQFKAIAAQLGVSEPRVSQLHARAMVQLRAILKDEERAAA